MLKIRRSLRDRLIFNMGIIYIYIGIPMLKIRRSLRYRLIFNMGIPIWYDYISILRRPPDRHHATETTRMVMSIIHRNQIKTQKPERVHIACGICL